MAFSIASARLVHASHLKKPVVLTETHVKQINISSDGENHLMFFAKLTKADVVAQRLLIGHTPKKGGAKLCHTNVLETLRHLRDEKRNEQINDLREQKRVEAAQMAASNMDGKIDVNIGGAAETAPPKKLKNRSQANATLPDPYITITAPALPPNVPSINIMVLIEQCPTKKGGIALWVHLSEITLNYLHQAVIEQMHSRAIHNVHSKTAHTPVGVVGLSRVCSGKRKGQYRYCQYGKKTTFFDASDDTAATSHSMSMKPVAQLALPALPAKLIDDEDAMTDDGS